MRSVNAREARERFKELLDSAEHGEVVAITRRGQEVARIVPPARSGGGRLPDLSAFRASIKVAGKPMSREVVAMRDEERS